MHFVYSRWRPDAATDDQRLQQLVSLFNYLVTGTSGDIEEALQWLRQLAEEYGLLDDDLTMDDLIDKLREMGLIADAESGLTLTSKGIRRIRQDALNEIFTSLKKAPTGSHETPFAGRGVERLNETRKFKFGDQPTDIDLTSTLTNAFRRDGIENFNLAEDDVEVYETEHQTSCATVLMIDISHSMILYGEDRITPAKQVAMALSELIMTQFPRDYLALVCFGDDATASEHQRVAVPLGGAVPHEHACRVAARTRSPAAAGECEQADLHGHGRQGLGHHDAVGQAIQEFFRAGPEDREQDARRGSSLPA